MIGSLFVFNTSSPPEVHEQLQEWRLATLHLYFVLIGIGGLLWLGSQTFASNETLAHFLTSVLPTALALGVTYILTQRGERTAPLLFSFVAFIAISWSIYQLRSPQVAFFYVILAMIVAVVVHPLGGVLIALGGVTVLCLFQAALPDVITSTDIWETAIFAGIAVVGVWSLVYRLTLALSWYVASYTRADIQMREARDNRAQVLQASKELDNAYSRLERAAAALQVAWKAADEAERAKMELATNISHELRTPLNLVVGYSEMMITCPENYGGTHLPQAYRADLSAIYRSAKHLLTLTDDVLDLARVEVGRLGLVKELVDLRELVFDATLLVRDYLESKRVELRLDLGNDPLFLEADRLRIRQVLLNLLANAARVTVQGWIRVRMVRQAENVLVSIEDTGPGIPPEARAGLFQRFSASSLSMQSGWHAGTGLGLAICRRFVELHSGTIGVDSTLGEGTTFWFTLPLKMPGQDQAPIAERPSANYLRPLDRMLVLAIPDAPLAYQLERHLDGFRIETAESLAIAETLAVELKASAIIADIETVVNATLDRGQVPIITCSFPRPESLAKHLGIADYLIKPISREALLRAIHGLGVPIRRVLVADDDSRFVRLVQRMLDSDHCEYQVSVAHNGEEALQKLRDESPDLLLLDLTMPKLGGIEVLAHLSSDAALKSQRVIVISAREETGNDVPLGAVVHIHKPRGFHLTELTEIIANVVRTMSPDRSLLDETVQELAPAHPGSLASRDN